MNLNGWPLPTGSQYRLEGPQHVSRKNLNLEPLTLAEQVRQRRKAWSAEELAELLNLSRKHIYKLCKQGRMPCVRIGGAVLFDPRVTADWLESKYIN